MSITIEPKSLAKLTKIAERYPAISQKHIDDAIVRSIGEVDRNMAPLTPVDTARLRNDIHGGVRFSPFRGRIGTDLPYARKVHDLHAPGIPYKNPAKNKNAVAGFMLVAADSAESLIQKTFENVLGKIVEELA